MIESSETPTHIPRSPPFFTNLFGEEISLLYQHETPSGKK